MSVKYKKVRRVVSEKQVHCDGPKHEGDTLMQCEAIHVSHGYGSPQDGDEQHFCSIRCLKDWARKQK